MTSALGIDRDTADAWAAVCLRALTTPFPYVTGHVTLGPDDLHVDPERLHPAFHGSLDWHSSCHMQWSLLRLLPGLGDAVRRDVESFLDRRLRAEAIAVEIDYLRRRPTFERPYGWAWAMMLVAAARNTRWESAVAPLGEHLGASLVPWFTALPVPVRHGVHSNTALALLLSLHAASELGLADLEHATRAHARRLFGSDTAAGWAQEPSAHDFLSPALTEATLMAEVLEDPRTWLTTFLAGVESADVLAPPPTADDADGQLAHLGGLAITRAWHLRRLAVLVPKDRADHFLRSATTQFEAAADRITSGDFMSTHWLVSYALLASETGAWTSR